MHDVAEEGFWSCGFEDGENGGGGKRRGELFCRTAKLDKDKGIGGEGGYAGEGGEGEELREVVLAFHEVLVGRRGGCWCAEGGCGEEEERKGVNVHCDC